MTVVALPIVFDKERRSPYSYRCHTCNRCCYWKGITVGPYELLRLARNRGCTTTALIRESTEACGTRLRTRPDGACVFLTPRGCGVHLDRPLVCRLYPLGRKVDAEGRESVGDLPPHPQTEGEYGTDGTVENYIRSQGAEEYIAVGERYSQLYGRMLAALARLGGSAEGGLAPGEHGESATPWLDVDATVAAYCADYGLAVPVAIDEVVTLHIRAVEAWLERLTADLRD